MKLRNEMPKIGNSFKMAEPEHELSLFTTSLDSGKLFGSVVSDAPVTLFCFVISHAGQKGDSTIAVGVRNRFQAVFLASHVTIAV
jgi:hypothetical protein